MRCLAGVLIMVSCCVGNAIADSTSSAMSDFKARVETNTKDLKDISFKASVKDVNKELLKKIDNSYTKIMELKEARISLKFPDKIRIEGKIGLVKFEYICSDGYKIARAPKIGFKKRDNFSDDPSRLQGPFDVGIITPTLWQTRRVEVVDDAEAKSRGEIRLKLGWLKGDMVYYAWVDAQNLWLKRLEKHTAQGEVKEIINYSDPKNLGGQLWIPTRCEVVTPEGAKVGASVLSDIKLNSGLQDSIFE